MTSYDFTDRTALITGGTRGIGYATARLLAASGANVLITGRKENTVESAAAAALTNEARTINPHAGRVIGTAAHVADPQAATAACALATDTFGSLDILINNAGTNPAFGPVVAQSAEIMTKVFQINTIAPAVWAGEAIKTGLGNREGAAIVNVSSIGALTMEDHIGVYNASKAALIHLTKQMARELAPTIRVNAVSPGVVRTKLSEALWKNDEAAAARLSPLRRIGEPEDIAEAIAFLAGPGTPWITGDNLVVDGGMLIGG